MVHNNSNNNKSNRRRRRGGGMIMGLSRMLFMKIRGMDFYISRTEKLPDVVYHLGENIRY